MRILFKLTTTLLIVLSMQKSYADDLNLEKEDATKALLQQCKKNNTSPTKYSICLDETMKKVERELTTWIYQTQEKLEKLAAKTGNESGVYEYKKANKFYQKYIESQCRSVFFELQSQGNAANEFRICKITKTIERIDQLKSQS